MSNEKGQQAAEPPPEQTTPAAAAAESQVQSEETAPVPSQKALVGRPSLFPPWTADPALVSEQIPGAKVEPENTEPGAEFKVEPDQNGHQTAQEPPTQALSIGPESAAVPQVESQVKSQATAPDDKNGSHSTLGSLAKRINAEHQQVFTALKAGLRHARNAGELLCKAKDQVRHGEWKQWVETNCEFSIRTAQVYMQISEGWEQVAAKAQQVAHLPMGQALKLLSGQPEPQNQPPLDDLIVGFTEKHQAGLTQAELVSEALKGGFQSGSGNVAKKVKRVCDRLVKKNRLSRDDEMRYHLVRPAWDESSANGELTKQAKQKNAGRPVSQAPLTTNDLVATLRDIEQQAKTAQLRSDFMWTKPLADECRTLLDQIKELVPTFEEASC